MELSPKAKQLRREYFRAWRKRNPERVKQHTQDFWERKATEAKDNEQREA